MSPVFRSVMVPSPLFRYRSAPPACTTPSSRTGASVIFRVGGYEVVCPVAGKVLLPQLGEGGGVHHASTAVAHGPRLDRSARLLARTRARHVFVRGPKTVMLFIVPTSA